MFSSSTSGSFAKSPHRGSRAFLVLGVVAILVNLCLIFNMFQQRPVYSEEAEVISGAISKARDSMTVEWIAADAKFKSRPAKGIVIERKQLVSLYRLRVFIVATEDQIPQLSRLLASLVEANYTNRSIPVDVDVHILGRPAGLPQVLWEHGRYDVFAHRLHGNANPSIPFVLTDVWQPQSSFELGVPLTATAVLSRHWFQWVLRVIQQYAAVSKEQYFHLEKTPDGSQLRSPLSHSLSGIALGKPVAGTVGNAAALVLSSVPSTTMVYTAECWKALLAQVGAGIDVDDAVATASWISFLGSAVTLLGKTVAPFLFPPTGKSGAFACDTAGALDAASCTLVDELTPAALETLMRLPNTVDMIPKMQGHDK